MNKTESKLPRSNKNKTETKLAIPDKNSILNHTQ